MYRLAQASVLCVLLKGRQRVKEAKLLSIDKSAKGKHPPILIRSATNGDKKMSKPRSKSANELYLFVSVTVTGGSVCPTSTIYGSLGSYTHVFPMCVL